MIAVIGDLHGQWQVIDTLSEYDIENTTFIQVGDFGFYNRLLHDWKVTKFPVYFIDGNHEDHDQLQHVASTNPDNRDVVEIKENLFYVRRGSVLEIDGFKIGFLGGGCSVDKYTRIKNNWHWSPKEVVTEADADRLIKNGKDIDILITHSPPKVVTMATLGPINKFQWGLPLDWRDESAHQVERVWNALDRPQIYCGHLHKSITYEKCRVLDINEIYTIPETR